MGATENAGFNATVQRQNLGLDFVTKQHKSLQKLPTSFQLCVIDIMLTHVNFPTVAMADRRYGRLIRVNNNNNNNKQICIAP